MKLFRKISVFIVIASLIPSCNLLEDCKTCRLVTDDGLDVTKGTGITTCGDKLEERLAQDPVTINGVTTYWECN